MSSLEELRVAAAQAAAAYEQAKKAARAEKLAEVKALIAEFGFTNDEVFRSKAPRSPNASKSPKAQSVAVYEKDGHTWSGKGRPPNWVIAARKDNTLENFKIEPPSAS